MTYQNGVCSVVSRLFHARPRTTYSSLVLANHARGHVGRGIGLNLPPPHPDKIAAISQNTKKHIEIIFMNEFSRAGLGFKFQSVRQFQNVQDTDHYDS